LWAMRDSNSRPLRCHR